MMFISLDSCYVVVVIFVIHFIRIHWICIAVSYFMKTFMRIEVKWETFLSSLKRIVSSAFVQISQCNGYPEVNLDPRTCCPFLHVRQRDLSIRGALMRDKKPREQGCPGVSQRLNWCHYSKFGNGHAKQKSFPKSKRIVLVIFYHHCLFLLTWY